MEAIKEGDLRIEKAMRRAAHDLKAPLSAMKGYVDMMLRGMAGPLTPTMQRYLDRLSQAIERERALIDLLLHAPPQRLAPVDLKQCVLASLDRSREAMDTKHLGLEFVAPLDPCQLQADRDTLELLVRRLIREMVRSAPQGAVIDVDLREEGPGWQLSLGLPGGLPGGTLNLQGGAICNAIARRLGGSVDFACQGGAALRMILPRQPSPIQATQVRSVEGLSHGSRE